MKIILIITLSLFLNPLQGMVPVESKKFEEQPGFEKNINVNPGDEILEDSNIFNTDPDILAVKPQQRTLPPLPGIERFKWSFKLAEKNIFL